MSVDAQPYPVFPAMPPDLVPGQDLSGFQSVFCESRSGLETARSLGLSAQAEVWCRSPALLTSGDPAVRQLDHRVEPAAARAFYLDTDRFLAACHRALSDEPELVPLATFICQQLSDAQVDILRAAQFVEADGTAPRLVVLPHAVDWSLWTPPAEILSCNSQARVLRGENLVADAALPPPAAGERWLARLQVMGWRHVSTP